MTNENEIGTETDKTLEELSRTLEELSILEKKTQNRPKPPLPEESSSEEASPEEVSSEKPSLENSSLEEVSSETPSSDSPPPDPSSDNSPEKPEEESTPPPTGKIEEKPAEKTEVELTDTEFGLDFLLTESPETLTPQAAKGVELVNPRSQIRFKNEGGTVQIIFPQAKQLSVKAHWPEIWTQLKHRLFAGERFWKSDTKVHLITLDQLLDGPQLKAIAKVLKKAGLRLTTVKTHRRKTAIAAASGGYSVQQESLDKKPAKQATEEQKTATEKTSEEETSAEHWDAPLYLRSTLRSGMEIQHPGTVVVLGDVNPGSTVIAAGDIIVVGRLRGITHAGSQGNRSCHIFALQMEAMQLRIADAIARPPASPPEGFYPEMAYIAKGGIRLAKAVNFFKTHSFSPTQNYWIDVQ